VRVKGEADIETRNLTESAFEPVYGASQRSARRRYFKVRDAPIRQLKKVTPDLVASSRVLQLKMATEGGVAWTVGEWVFG